MALIKSSKNQAWTLPPDIRDPIPSDHICYLVKSFVDEMDFSEFEIRYNSSGHPSYPPCIMCKILIQSMLDRVRSSREIARNVRENVVYMYLAENLQPDFRTISDFRKDNEKLIIKLFKSFLKDGTKICADSGYYSGNNIHYLNDKKLDPYIPG